MVTKVQVFGITMIPDGRVKHLLRKSPGANARARAIGECARGKRLLALFTANGLEALLPIR